MMEGSTRGERQAGEETRSGWRSELPRVLGAWSAASILIGSIIGSGVFIKPKTVAEALPSPGWILFCWIAAGVLALIGSLIFAELGSVYPGAGGQYTYLRESFGKLTAFLFGWTNLLIINSASIAALAVISSQYFFNLLPEGSRPAADSHWVSTASVIFIAFLTAANSIGVRWGAAIQNILTVTKLAAIALVISGIFHPAKTSWSNLSPFWDIRGASPDADILAGFKGAFIAIFWAYDGWYLLSFSGGEIKNPRRNIPLGFILGILVVIAVYAAANLSYLLVMDLGEMKDVERLGGVAAEVTSRLYGQVGLLIFSVGIMGSTLGAANGNLLTGPRLSYAMARDGLFFRAFGRVHPRFLTPLSAIVLQGVIGVFYVYCGTFDQLTDSVVFAAWTFYLLTVLGYFVLRRRHRSRTDVFLAPGFPVLPLIFVAFAAWFIAYNFMDSGTRALQYLSGDAGPEAKNGIYAIVSAALIVLGIPVYYALRSVRPR